MIKRADIYDCEFIDRTLRIPEILESTIDDLQMDFLDRTSYINKLLDIDNYIFIFIFNKEKQGFISFFPVNSIVYDTHISVIDNYRGKQTIKDTIESIKWMFDNTKCRKLIGFIPEFNKKAIAFAKNVGYSEEGISKRSFIKNRKLFNRIILSLEKGEF